jgi:multicomponent Na+:H+ antiporter subunit C
MGSGLLFAVGGLGVLLVGSWAMVLRTHLIRKILALNVMSSGVFLLLVGAGAMGGAGVDPVPQAMVITGIVVSISATALGLAIVLRIAKTTGQAVLPEDREQAPVDRQRR